MEAGLQPRYLRHARRRRCANHQRHWCHGRRAGRVSTAAARRAGLDHQLVLRIHAHAVRAARDAGSAQHLQLPGRGRGDTPDHARAHQRSSAQRPRGSGRRSESQGACGAAGRLCMEGAATYARPPAHHELRAVQLVSVARQGHEHGSRLVLAGAARQGRLGRRPHAPRPRRAGMPDGHVHQVRQRLRRHRAFPCRGRGSGLPRGVGHDVAAAARLLEMSSRAGSAREPHATTRATNVLNEMYDLGMGGGLV
mmetsp:Transcript_20800/g.42581  ORF Transcript_20800/g.42581 Transcript_20800/m.42581 type:complete len:252 (+) Transcript_20800:163-918(+)